MKSILLFVCVLLPFRNAFAQEEEGSERTYIYQTIKSIRPVLVDVNGDRIEMNYTVISPPVNSRFYFERKIRDSILIKFWKWDKPTTVKDSEGKFIRYEPNKNYLLFNTPYISKSTSNEIERYFLVSKGDFDSSAIPRYKTWHTEMTLGVTTLPIKIRPGNNFDFEPTISLGLSVGPKWRTSHFKKNYLLLLGGIGVSTVNLDKSNTTLKDTNEEVNIKNVAVLSPNIGCLFQFGKIQVGYFIGGDFMNKANQEKYQWTFNKNLWMGIGIGLSIFNIDTKAIENANKSKENQSAPQ